MLSSLSGGRSISSEEVWMWDFTVVISEDMSVNSNVLDELEGGNHGGGGR